MANYQKNVSTFDFYQNEDVKAPFIQTDVSAMKSGKRHSIVESQGSASAHSKKRNMQRDSSYRYEYTRGGSKPREPGAC